MHIIQTTVFFQPYTNSVLVTRRMTYKRRGRSRCRWVDCGSPAIVAPSDGTIIESNRKIDLKPW